MKAVLEVTPITGSALACRALGVSRATLHRYKCNVTHHAASEMEPERPAAVANVRPRPVNALSPEERQVVLDVLHDAEFVDRTPAEIWATLLDRATYFASIRTMYRILEEHSEVRERRNQARATPYAAPELLATGPNQVWSWDITLLKGPVKMTYFQLYLILDIFSRYVVGWMVAEREHEELAKLLIEDTYMKQGIAEGQLTVHADRGSSMKSHTVAQLLSNLGVIKSHSRPSVSNDNPYSESQFKTLKYSPGFPERFASIEHAREHCRTFITWYNTQHHHSGIGLLTPEVLHYGRQDEVLVQRQRCLDKAYSLHPERFSCRPTPPDVPTAVYINPPTRERAPGTDVQ